MFKPVFVILFCFLAYVVPAQTLGGNAVFSFLKLSNTSQLTALGGVNVSHTSNDVGLAFNNPSLLRPAMHGQVNAVFNSFYAGINTYHLAAGYRHEKLNTNFLWGLHYLNYGEITGTDPSGNIMGDIRPTDWVMHVSASRSYLEKWNYGLTLKYINSNYGQYRSNGIAVDVGINYRDSSGLLSVSLLAKNMGTQLRKYTGTERDDLPFDLQIGISKRLESAPFSFSLTAFQLHQFDSRYNDTLYNNETGTGTDHDGKFFFDKLFRHFVFATTIYLGEHVEVQAAYNHLRRKELSVSTAGNGLTGFSVGATVLLDKLQVRYARSQYQNNTGYNQFGINFGLIRKKN